MSKVCRLLEITRSSYYYKDKRKEENKLRKLLHKKAAQRRRWGYRRLLVLLRREGIEYNHKKIYRIYKEEGLQIRKRKRKKMRKYRGEKPVREAEINSNWSMDFVHDSTCDGRKVRMLNIVDDYTRECLWIEVDTSLTGARVTKVLDYLIKERGKPKALTMDNGPEFTGVALDKWAYKNEIKLQHIEPGKPIQNAYIESFNGKLRDECLNENWFMNLSHAREIIADWRKDYNEVRPHSSLNNLTPIEFVGKVANPLGGYMVANTKKDQQTQGNMLMCMT